MTVADLQLHLQHLSQFLAAGGSQTQAEALRSFSEKLEPFKGSSLAAFGEFLEQSADTQGKPAPQESKGGRKKGTAVSEEVRQLFERVRYQFHHAHDATVTREEIEAAVLELGPLSKTQLEDLASQIEITKKYRSQGDLLKAIRQKLLDRKGDFERLIV